MKFARFVLMTTVLFLGGCATGQFSSGEESKPEPLPKVEQVFVGTDSTDCIAIAEGLLADFAGSGGFVSGSAGGRGGKLLARLPGSCESQLGFYHQSPNGSTLCMGALCKKPPPQPITLAPSELRSIMLEAFKAGKESQ